MGGNSEGWDKPGLHGADLAALLGATIALLVTITSGPGAWGPLATITGSLLLVALLAFFWRRRPRSEEQARSADHRGKWSSFFAWEKWEPLFVGFALSVIIGCVVAITFAQAFQLFLSPDKDQSECRSVAVAAATTTARDLRDRIASDNDNALKDLINYTWQHGHETGKPTYVDPLVSYAFYHQYDATVGDCLASDTFSKLWWIALPAFLGALLWWYWNVIMRRISRIMRRIMRRAAPSPVSLLTIKCQRQRERRIEEAIGCYEQSLAIRREIGGRCGEGQTLNNLGNAYHGLRRFEEAIGCYEQSLAIRREIGGRGGEGQTLNNLGNAYLEMGQRDRAVKCWREAAAAMRDAGDHEQAGRLEQRAADAQARRRRWWRRGSRSAGN